MSAICIVNLKESNLISEFDNYNRLARELIQFALNNDIAIFFNSYDYGEEIIRDGGMKNFFLMSDSFLYKNCEFLNTIDLAYDWGSDRAKQKFMKKYGFLKEMLKIVFRYDVQLVELFVSDDGSVDCVSDFEELKSSSETFLTDIYDYILAHAWKDAYCFPTVKLVIENPNLQTC